MLSTIRTSADPERERAALAALAKVEKALRDDPQRVVFKRAEPTRNRWQQVWHGMTRPRFSLLMMALVITAPLLLDLVLAVR